MSHDRHVRRHAGGRLVERRQMIEVQDVSLRGAGSGQLTAPGLDLPLEGDVIEFREDAVRSARPVLE